MPPDVMMRQSGAEKNPFRSPKAGYKITQLNTHNQHKDAILSRETSTHLVDVGPCLDELTDYNILSIVAGQMEWGVAIGIHLIYLCENRKKTYVYV